MRNLLLVLLLVGLAACDDEVLPTKPVPAARKTALAKRTVNMPRVDTTRASSICKASVRAGGRIKVRLDAEPSDTAAARLERRAIAYATLIADACR